MTSNYPPIPPKKNTGLIVVALIVGSFMLLGIGGVIGVGHRETIVVTTPGPTIITVGPTTTVTATTTMTTAATTAATTAPTAAGATTGITDGTYLVGTEIASGTYKSSGGMATDSMCYVETQDKAGNVLDGEIGLGGGSMTFKIPPDAYKFKATGCGTWTKIG